MFFNNITLKIRNSEELEGSPRFITIFKKSPLTFLHRRVLPLKVYNVKILYAQVTKNRTIVPNAADQSQNVLTGAVVAGATGAFVAAMLNEPTKWDVDISLWLEDGRIIKVRAKDQKEIEILRYHMHEEETREFNEFVKHYENYYRQLEYEKNKQSDSRVENGSMNVEKDMNVKQVPIEYLHENEEKTSVRIENVSVIGDYNSTKIFGEVYSVNNVELSGNITINAIVYDQNGSILDKRKDFIPTKNFTGFDVFDIRIINPVNNIGKIKLYVT